MGWLSMLLGLFGGGGGKDVVGETADIVDKFHPSEVTRRKMDAEDVRVGDESQASARGFQPAQTVGFASWWDDFIDGLNRLPRPMFAFWAFGELAGLVPPPRLDGIHPVVLNIIWTVVGFYFGVRTISQDLPKAVGAWYQVKALVAANAPPVTAPLTNPPAGGPPDTFHTLQTTPTDESPPGVGPSSHSHK